MENRVVFKYTSIPSKKFGRLSNSIFEPQTSTKYYRRAHLQMLRIATNEYRKKRVRGLKIHNYRLYSWLTHRATVLTEETWLSCSRVFSELPTEVGVPSCETKSILLPSAGSEYQLVTLSNYFSIINGSSQPDK